MMLSLDHGLLERSWYGFTKFLNQFFRRSRHVLEIYVLIIEENYLICQISWKFSLTLRTSIL